MPSALLALLIAAQVAAPGFVDGLVPNESGFDGAVTVAATTVEDDFGCITVNVPYLDVYGKPKMGQARLIVRRNEVQSGKPIPVFSHVHYEKDFEGAKSWCRRGWAVTTAHYGAPAKREYPLDTCIGDSYNLAKAIIEWVRRLPFVDRRHLHIDGGSAGGYMALAMSAEMFPVCATTADVPVVNWAFNLNYIEVNRPASLFPIAQKDSPMPVLCGVTALADQCLKVFDRPYDDETWYYLSPISYLDRITSPTMIVCATGDMLVPHDQITRKFPHPADASLFPPEFTRNFDALTLVDQALCAMDELIPQDRVFMELLPRPEGLHEFTFADVLSTGKLPPGPRSTDRPWQKDKQWSIVVLDDGPPLPWSSHGRYQWPTSPDSFVDYYQRAQLGADRLNEAKLERLLRRYTGEMDEKALLTDGTPVGRRNFDLPEKLDAVTGLLDYATVNRKDAKRLKALYKTTPVHPFGKRLWIRELRAERKRLLRRAESASKTKEAA